MAWNRKTSQRAAIAAGVLVLVVGVMLWRRSREEQRLPSLASTLRGLEFSTLCPPSTLYGPGTLVTILRRDPTVPGILCPIDTALAPAARERILKSDSVSLKATGALSGEFSLEAELGAKLRASGADKDVQTVSVVLTNVRVKEIPDDVVFDFLTNRTTGCASALDERRKEGKEISIIKSVLVADAAIEVTFRADVTAEVKARVTETLAATLGAGLHAEGGTQIVGQGLIWGIRDDRELANAGGKSLPSTGTRARTRLIEAAAVVDGSDVRLEMPEIVGYDVKPIRQPTRMSCWATVLTMLTSWRDRRERSIDDVVGALGAPWTLYHGSDTGLPAGEEKALARKAGFVTERPANYSMKGWIELLQNFGPLWITVGDGISSHALVLVSAHGDGTFEGSFFGVIDPASGTASVRPAARFAEEFEKEASRGVGPKDDPAAGLRVQVLHWPKR